MIDFSDIETYVLELCCFEWSQNDKRNGPIIYSVLELCCFEWF